MLDSVDGAPTPAVQAEGPPQGAIAAVCYARHKQHPIQIMFQDSCSHWMSR